MMKKIISLAIILTIAFQCKAQFVNSIGLTAGVSLGNQKFFFKEPAAISKKKYTVGFNASFFAEFFSHDYARWLSEIQYNQKGSIDKQPEQNYPNKLQYLSWNNYLKLRYEMYSIIPYILVGPRLDYMLTQSTTSPEIVSSFSKLNISAGLGGGVEFISYSNFKFLVEAFYNPDITPAYVTPELHVKNKNIELRIGLKYEFAGRKESCITPTYVE